MRKNSSLTLAAVLLSASAFFYSCQKSIDQPASFDKLNTANKASASQGNGVNPYQFERINEYNFFSQGWKEQQVNIVSGVTTFSDLSDNVEIVCGPENTSDQRLINGCVTMNLPTGADPTLRRIRLRRGGYSGTLLSDLTELKYSTYVVQNSPTIIVLQIDVTGDDVKDFNIFWEPRAYIQSPDFPPLVLNTWQQWDPLNQGVWHIEVAVVPLPGGLADLTCTIPEVVAGFPTARIIDTPPIGNNGEGVRFTIGGTPRSLYDNTIGYFDALIIGTRDQQHSTLFDFMCNQGND
jgi:hypothetical protein